VTVFGRAYHALWCSNRAYFLFTLATIVLLQLVL